MKKLLLILFAFAALLPAAPDNINGTWQGTLNLGPRQLRIVVKISVGDNDKLKATLYSIDQDGPPIPATAITRDGATIKMTVAPINGSYEGKLTADGNTIEGTFTQGAPLPMNLARATPATEWTIPEPAPPPVVMAADAKPQFEVATIKPSDTTQPGIAFTVNRSGWLITKNTSAQDLIKISWGLQPRQITNAPSWFATDKFDVTGKPDTPGTPGIAQLMSMTQKMMADRFALKFHREKKEMTAYVLTLGKGPLKINEDTSNPKGLPGFGGGGRGGLNVRNATMQEFVEFLQAQALDLPVVDQTGLGEKRYDFVLKWTPDNQPASDAADAPPGIYVAMQEQLGLKLESTKAPVDLFVIDHIEKPSEN